ncbi:MAG: hypothetical protein ABIJ96_04820 [Elusimicrobiota bacterium]
MISSNKFIVAIVGAAILCCLLLAFWAGVQLRGHSAPIQLAQGLDAQLSKWTAGKVPPSQRAVTLIFGASGTDRAPLDAPEGEVYLGGAWGDEPSGGLAQEHPPLIKAMAELPDTAAWTFAGIKNEQEAEIVQQIADIITQAHEAGAEINVVSQRDMIVPVMKALKTLEGVSRGGAQVGVNKIVALGMRKSRLQKIYPGALRNAGSRNYYELANVYLDRGSASPATTVELFSDRHQEGTTYRGSYMLLGSAGHGVSATELDLAKSLIDLAKSIKSMDKLFAERQQEAAKSLPKKAPPPRQMRALDGTISVQGGGRKRASAASPHYGGGYKYEKPAAPAQQTSSLGFVKKEEGMVGAAGGAPPAEEKGKATKEIAACAEENLYGVGCKREVFDPCVEDCRKRYPKYHERESEQKAAYRQCTRECEKLYCKSMACVR